MLEEQESILEDLFREWRATGREELREQIIQQALPLALSIARRYANRGEPLEDLEGQAVVGLINAVDRYDPSRDVKFITFATPTIMGEIKRYFRNRGWAVKVPRRIQDLVLQVRKVGQELEQELGRAPLVSEIATVLQVREEDVLEAMEAARGYDVVSWESEVLSDDQEEESTPLQEVIGGENDDIERYMLRQMIQEALEILEPRERYIIERRYLYDEASQSEVARELGISQMHVSRLERRAIQKMRRYLREEEGSEEATPSRSRQRRGDR